MDGNIDRELDRLDARVNETAARASARLHQVVGQASSPDVTVVVAPGGMLHEVAISRDAMRGSPDALAAEIVRLAGRATRNAGAQVHESLRGVLDAPSAAGLVELGVPERGAPDDEPEGDGVLRRIR